ncbi:MAG TPA: alanine racemase [Micromonosporaceae bacterium]|nr:alanine racemase [Micromonosporaceae bacterium]
MAADPRPAGPRPAGPGPVGPGPVEPVPGRVAAAVRRLPRPVCGYVYDAATLRARVALLRGVLPPRVRLLYAVKANGHPEVVRTVAATVDGLEVASGGELALALGCGTGTGTGTDYGTGTGRDTSTGPDTGTGRDAGPGTGRLVAFSGPGKTDAELAAAVDAGAVVHVESLHELRRLSLAAVAASPGPGRGHGCSRRPVPVALRVNRPGAPLPGSHAMTGTATPFGIDAAQLDRAAALAAALPGLDLIGFHLHAVSNNTDAAAHAAFLVDAVQWSVRTAARLRLRLRYVNAGGGLGVGYTGTAAELDLGVLGGGLRRAVADLPDGAELVLEPGRFLAADAGWYAAEVLDLKPVHGRWFAVLRGGTHHFRLPAAWGYSHPCTVLPVEEWPYPFDRPQLRHATVDVAGELCTPRDVLARDRRFDLLRAGDILVFARTGAYGWEVSHHDFLRHPYPELVFLP